MLTLTTLYLNKKYHYDKENIEFVPSIQKVGIILTAN